MYFFNITYYYDSWVIDSTDQLTISSSERSVKGMSIVHLSDSTQLLHEEIQLTKEIGYLQSNVPN